MSQIRTYEDLFDAYGDYDDDDDDVDDDFEEEKPVKEQPKKQPRVYIKKLEDDDDDDFEEPPKKQPRVYIKKLEDDDDDFEESPPDNPEDYWKNLKDPTYAKNLEEYFQSFHDEEKEKEYWKLHPKKVSEEVKKICEKAGVDLDKMPTAMYKIAQNRKRSTKWAELLNKYANENNKNIYVGCSWTIGEDHSIDDIWNNHEQIVILTDFIPGDKRLRLIPEGSKEDISGGGHATLLVLFPKRKDIYSYDSSTWLTDKEKVENMILYSSSFTSSLRSKIIDEVFDMGWHYHIRAMDLQKIGTDIAGACATFSCWNAMWSVLYPNAVLDNYSPPMFPGGVNTFLSYMYWCLKIGRIVLPDEKIIQAVTYHGEGWRGNGKVSSYPLNKKRTPLYYLFQSLTV